MLEERAAVAVREERDLIRPVLLLDLQELLGRKVERLLPGDLLEGLVAPLSGRAQERRLQPVRVVQEARSPGATRAEPYLPATVSPSVPGSWMTSASSPHHFVTRPDPATAAPKPAPLIWMNWRRVVVMPFSPGPPFQEPSHAQDR